MKPNYTARPEKPCGVDKTSRTKRRSAALYQRNEESEAQASGQNACENGKRGCGGKRGRKNAMSRRAVHKKTVRKKGTVSERSQVPVTQSA
jgi:hypothetical protein